MSQKYQKAGFLAVLIQRHALIRKAQAVAGSNITGNVSGTLRSFLKEPSLPTYYKMKTYLALSGADEENEAKARRGYGALDIQLGSGQKPVSTSSRKAST